MGRGAAKANPSELLYGGASPRANSKVSDPDERHKLQGGDTHENEGTTTRVLEGLMHCEFAPALERADGMKAWYFTGVPHRADGPAVTRPDGKTEFWVDGVQVAEPVDGEQPALPPPINDRVIAALRAPGRPGRLYQLVHQLQPKSLDFDSAQRTLRHYGKCGKQVVMVPVGKESNGTAMDKTSLSSGAVTLGPHEYLLYTVKTVPKKRK